MRNLAECLRVVEIYRHTEQRYDGTVTHEDFANWPCSDCDGDGEHTCDCGHYHECKSCNGVRSAPENDDKQVGWAVVIARDPKIPRIGAETHGEAEHKLAILKEQSDAELRKLFFPNSK